LPAQSDAVGRDLQIVYETPGGMSVAGEVQTKAPKLLVRAESSKNAVEVPQANLVWTLILPTGYQVRRSEGTVFTQDVQPREVAAVRAAKWLWELANVNPLGRGMDLQGGTHAKYPMKTEAATATAIDRSESMQLKLMEKAAEMRPEVSEDAPKPDAKPNEMPAEEKKEESKSEKPRLAPATPPPATEPAMPTPMKAAADDPFADQAPPNSVDAERTVSA